MERTFRASNTVFWYAAFLLFDTGALARESRQAFAVGGAGGVLLAVLALCCLACAALLLWRYGRVVVVVTPEMLAVRGAASTHRIYWTEVDRVRELHGPAYQLSLQGLLPGPYLPHGLLNGETVLEILVRPGVRLVFRRSLIARYDEFREETVRMVPKSAEIDLRARWWRD